MRTGEADAPVSSELRRMQYGNTECSVTFSEAFSARQESPKEMGRRIAEVPTDWYVDPADPQAQERFRSSQEAVLEAQVDALRTLRDLGQTEETFATKARSGEQAIWIGGPAALPGFGDDDELSWQADALCAQTDPEVFFPEKGGSTRDAKKVCGSCSVRAKCLEYALSRDERFGIWGGLSERERRRLRKRAV